MCEFISPHQLCISLSLLLLLPEWAHQSEAQTNPTRSRRSLLFYAICCHWQLTFKCHCRHMFIALKSLSNLCRPYSHCRQPFNNCRSVFHFCHTSRPCSSFYSCSATTAPSSPTPSSCVLPLSLGRLFNFTIHFISNDLSMPQLVRCRYLAISTRLCLFYAYSVCADSSVSPVSSAFYASFTSFSAPSTSFTAFLCHRKSEKPKATPVKMFEFDVLTVCPRLALCYSCLAYATTSLSKRTPILGHTSVCVCVCV